MQLAEKGLLELDRPLGEYLGSKNHGGDITPRHLLTHSSGLPAHEELWHRRDLKRAGDGSLADKKRVAEYLLHLSEKAQSPAKTVPTYSDLGFILLGILIERLAGKGLEASFYEMVERCSINGLYSQALIGQQGLDASCAPTGWCPHRKRMLRAEVHDMNAWFLGGFAGHAGLFGTIEAVTEFLARLLASFKGCEANSSPASQDMVKRFWTPGTAKKSPWALGFDLPSSKGSSAGRHFSKRSVGHLGYTGTSFWIDLERGIGMVLLTNRTFPMDTPASRQAIKKVRPAIHDAVMEPIAAP
jgi:CubicO group peptidase (beta-lactamase class C family)